MSEEEVYLSSMACCIELIRTGSTCFDDPGGYNMHRAVQAVTEAGVRANIKRSVTDIHTTGRPLPAKMNEGTDDGLAAGEEFVKKYNGAANGRISAWFSCRTERTSSSDLLAKTTALCKKHGVGFGTHMVSNPDSVNRHKEVFHGKKAVVRYHEAGALGPHLITYHTNIIDEEELELLDEYQVGVVHCPTASFAGAYGAISEGFHPEMFQRGMKHGLGCDTAPESNFVDMFRVMFSVTAHRDYRLDATLFPPEHILEMGTLGGGAGNEHGEAGRLAREGQAGGLDHARHHPAGVDPAPQHHLQHRPVLERGHGGFHDGGRRGPLRGPADQDAGRKGGPERGQQSRPGRRQTDGARLLRPIPVADAVGARGARAGRLRSQFGTVYRPGKNLLPAFNGPVQPGIPSRSQESSAMASEASAWQPVKPGQSFRSIRKTSPSGVTTASPP